MSNNSYAFSYSTYESIHRLINTYMGDVQTTLFGEVVNTHGEFPGEAIIKIINIRTKTDNNGVIYHAPFPNLMNVPVLNTFQNITCPKVTTGQRGVIVFNKHVIPDEDLIIEDIDVLPNPTDVFSLNDALFVPTSPQLEPQENVTQIETDLMKFVSNKFEVLNNQNKDLIDLLTRTLISLGQAQVSTEEPTVPLSTLAPNFVSLIADVATFVNE